jgi:hypothetical protein
LQVEGGRVRVPIDAGIVTVRLRLSDGKRGSIAAESRYRVSGDSARVVPIA